MPSQQPGYRQGPFPRRISLTNLEIAPEAVKAALKNAFAQAGETLCGLPGEKINDLSRTKYSTGEWNLKF